MKETMLMIAIAGIITGFSLLAILLLLQPKTDFLLKIILEGTLVGGVYLYRAIGGTQQ